MFTINRTINFPVREVSLPIPWRTDIHPIIKPLRTSSLIFILDKLIASEMSNHIQLVTKFENSTYVQMKDKQAKDLTSWFLARYPESKTKFIYNGEINLMNNFYFSFENNGIIMFDDNKKRCNDRILINYLLNDLYEKPFLISPETQFLNTIVTSYANGKTLMCFENDTYRNSYKENTMNVRNEFRSTTKDIINFIKENLSYILIIDINRKEKILSIKDK